MKVLVADDHPLVRSGIKGVLHDFDPAAIVFEAVDFPAVSRVIESHPDLNLVLLDLNMPGGGGLPGLRELRDGYPALSIVVLSGSENLRDMRGALDAGAKRFTDAMLFAAATSIAENTPEGQLVPHPLDKSVHEKISLAVYKAACEKEAQA